MTSSQPGGADTEPPGELLAGSDPANNQERPRPKLIIGFDGRDASDDALALGAELCRLLDAQPLVLSVAPWPRFMHGENLKIALELDTGESLSRAAAQLAGLDPIVKAVVHRSASEELCLVARKEEATALVVGASHRGKLGQILLGSVGSSLLHGAPCAVAIAPLGYKETQEPPTRIAVAFDGSPESWPVLEAGIRLASRAGGTLSILTVAETDFYVARAAWPALPFTEMIEVEREHAQQLLDKAVSQVPDDLSPRGRYMEGSARELLPELTGEYDLMLVGSRGHGPLGQTILGSVAAALIDGSECPVMVLPRSAAIERLPDEEAGAVESSS